MSKVISEFKQLRAILIERGRELLRVLSRLNIDGDMRIESATPIFLPQEFDRTCHEFVNFFDAHRKYHLFLEHHNVSSWTKGYDAGLIEDEIHGRPANKSANMAIVQSLHTDTKSRRPENPTLDEIKHALEQCFEGLPHSDGPIERIAFRLGADTLAWAHRSLDKLRLYDRPPLPPHFGKDAGPIVVRNAIAVLLAWFKITKSEQRTDAYTRVRGMPFGAN